MKKTLAALLFCGVLWAQTPVSLNRTRPSIPMPTITMHVETIPLLGTPTGTPTITYALKSAPIPNMGCIVIYSSSQPGGDATRAVTNVQPPLVITLPTGITFTADDVVTVIYWAAN